MGEPGPTKSWLVTSPATISRRPLVDLTKPRWRIARDDQDFKQDLGLGHHAGRGWRGVHHRATLCIAARGVLVAERGAFPLGGAKAGTHRDRSATSSPPTARRSRSGLNATSVTAMRTSWRAPPPEHCHRTHAAETRYQPNAS